MAQTERNLPRGVDITRISYSARPEPGSSGRVFCIIPSSAYLELLEECGGDPKSVTGTRALVESGPNAEKGWQPTWDARERIES